MRTAVCFTGTARSLEHTHENLKENLIAGMGDCDIIALIAENPHAHKAEQYFKELPNHKIIKTEEEADHNISNFTFRPNWPGRKLSSKQIYLKMIDSRKRCGQLVSEQELQSGIIYDRIVFSRLDVKYFNNVSKLVAGLDMNKIYIPDFHNTFGGAIDGYNDRFAVGNRENMKTYFDLPDSLIPFTESGGQIHAETILKWHMIKNQVEVEKIPLRFTRVRPGGEVIDLRLQDSVLELQDT
tara:strand:- start:1762 stop:2481 length:720 start_codon:yes stop_codon:yes gene_type:complete